MAITDLEKTKVPGVYRQPDGRFVAVAVIRDGQGKQIKRRQVLPESATLTQAAAAVEGLKQALLQPQVEAKAIPSFANYAEQWLIVKASRLRDGVTREWTHRLGVHILPVEIAGKALGHYRLDEIRRLHVEGWVAWAESVQQPSGKPYSPASVAGWWRLITQVLRDAAADYDLPDPTRRVTAPEVHAPKVRETRTLDKAALETFLGAVEHLQPGRYAEIAFLGYTGCRPGEAYGLHWKDVALDGDTPNAALKFSATRGKLERTKTDSPRVVPLVPALVAALKEHRQQQMSGKVAQWDDGQGALVFPSDSKTYRIEQSLAKPCDLCSAAVGQKVTPQVLRRSVNTILLASGVNPITVREMMGHTTEAMSARYSSQPLAVKADALGRALG